MKNRRSARYGLLAAVATLSFAAAACGDDEEPADTTAGGDTGTTEMTGTTTMGTDMTGTTTMGTGTTGTEGAGPTGPACESVPAEGEGSFEGMADDPAATAASNNEELSTLVDAVTAAELVDTLNGEGPFTILAPANSAFAKVPAADLEALLADKDMLTGVLTYHVIAGEKLSGADLAESGMQTSVSEQELTFAMEGDALSINDGQATVVCADIPTANATVHIIDGVLAAPA